MPAFNQRILTASAPVYTAELAPAELRGLFVGMNGVLIAGGYALASYMGLAFFFARDPATQWRAPLGLALVFPFMMLTVIFFVPESPRWLLMQGRSDEAWKVISDLHADPSDPDSEYARKEFYQIQKQTEIDRTLNPTWKEMFVKPSYRRRSIMAIVFAFIGQSTAILVVNNYVSYFSGFFQTFSVLIISGPDTLQVSRFWYTRSTYPPMWMDHWSYSGKLPGCLDYGPNWETSTYAFWHRRLYGYALHRSRDGSSLCRRRHQ